MRQAVTCFGIVVVTLAMAPGALAEKLGPGDSAPLELRKRSDAFFGERSSNDSAFAGT